MQVQINQTTNDQYQRPPPLNWSPGINAMVKIKQMRRSQSAKLKQKKMILKAQENIIKTQHNSIDQNNLARIQVRCATEYIKSFNKYQKDKNCDFFGDGDSDSPETEFYRCCSLKTRLYESIKQLQFMKLQVNKLETFSTTLMIKQLPFIPFNYACLIMWFTSQLLLSIFRYSGYTTALFKFEASGWDFFTNMFIYITTGLGYSFVHTLLNFGVQQLNASAFKKLNFKFPLVIIDVIFTFWYTADIAIQAIELVLQLETSGNVSVDYFFAYMLTYKKPTSQSYYEQGDKTIDVGQKIFQYTVKYHGGKYLYLLIAVSTPIVLLFIYFIVYLPENVKVILPNIQNKMKTINKLKSTNYSVGKKQKYAGNIQLLEVQQYDTEQEQTVNTFNSDNDTHIDQNEKYSQQQFKTVATFQWKCFKIRRIDFKHPIFNIFFIFQLAGFICVTIYIIVYAACNDAFKMEAIMPTTIKFINQGPTKSLNDKLYKSYVQDFRSEKTQYMKNNGLYFLDNRDKILFPTVTGTADQFCSYNYEINRSFCDSWLEQQENIQNLQTRINKAGENASEMPNILFLIIESLSPAPRYVDDNYAQKSDGKAKLRKNTTFYKDEVMPKINKLATSGIVMPQTSAVGLPTIFGFLGMATTEKPLIGAINIVRDSQNEDEAFSRQLKASYDFYTSYVASTPLEFDYENAWALNKQWYDEVHYFYPTDTQMKILGLEKGSHISWLSDRISSRITAINVAKLFAANGKVSVSDAAYKFYTFFNQTPDYQMLNQYLNEEVDKLRKTDKIKKNQPLFFQLFTTDTHNPFSGFDNASFYTQFSNENNDSYQTVLKNTDHYLGQLIEFVKLFDNNTLVFLTGDHGMHEETVLKTGGEIVNSNLKMNKKYQFGHVGSDIMFDVSAVIADLYEGKILAQFGIEPNSVLEAAFDHDDLIESLFDILSRFQTRKIESFNKPEQTKNSQAPLENRYFKPISGRHGQSLIDIIQQLENNTYEDDKLQTSFTDVVLQGKYRGKTLRSNTKKLTNSVLMSNYVPSFTMFLNGTEVQTFYEDKQMKKNLYDKIVARQLLYTHLGGKNMLYSHTFENKLCGYSPETKNFTLCELPQRLNVNTSYRSEFLTIYFGLIIIGGGILVAICTILVFYIIHASQMQCQRKKMRQQ